MSHIIIESTNKNDSPTDIEEKLEKAVSAIKLQRENKSFPDKLLKDKMDKADVVVNKLFSNMIDEIAGVLLKDEKS